MRVSEWACFAAGNRQQGQKREGLYAALPQADGPTIIGPMTLNIDVSCRFGMAMLREYVSMGV